MLFGGGVRDEAEICGHDLCWKSEAVAAVWERGDKGWYHKNKICGGTASMYFWFPVDSYYYPQYIAAIVTQNS